MLDEIRVANRAKSPKGRDLFALIHILQCFWEGRGACRRRRMRRKGSSQSGKKDLIYLPAHFFRSKGLIDWDLAFGPQYFPLIYIAEQMQQCKRSKGRGLCVGNAICLAFCPLFFGGKLRSAHYCVEFDAIDHSRVANVSLSVSLSLCVCSSYICAVFLLKYLLSENIARGVKFLYGLLRWRKGRETALVLVVKPGLVEAGGREVIMFLCTYFGQWARVKVVLLVLS